MSRVLPAGYETQPASGFHDPTGRFTYEFIRVYGSPTRAGGAEPTRDLDEGLSHWSVIWPERHGDDDERPAERSITYDEARARTGGRLSFARFSSGPLMSDVLPGLLRPGESETV